MNETAARILDFAEPAELRDGTIVRVRPIRRDDVGRLRRFFYRLSPQTVYMRFFSPVHRPPERILRYLTDVDGLSRYAVVGLVGDEISGVARFDRSPDNPRYAEIAVVVEDAHQGKGLGRILLDRLSTAARALGLEGFTASMLAGNHRAISFAKSAPGATFGHAGNELETVIPLPGIPADPSLPRALQAR